jgi:hypothetical protein
MRNRAVFITREDARTPLGPSPLDHVYEADPTRPFARPKPLSPEEATAQFNYSWQQSAGGWPMALYHLWLLASVPVIVLSFIFL